VAAFARLQREIPGWVAWRDTPAPGGVTPAPGGIYYVERSEVSDA
jgi:hypothetical protein